MTRPKLQTCALCGAVGKTAFYYHPGTNGHGIDGWPSEQPLCSSCTRLMIWGRTEAPINRKRGKKCE